MDPPRPTVSTLVQRVQHVSQLRSAGFSRSDLDSHVADGSIVRVRRGWYAAADAHPSLVAAVRIGGALTAASAAEVYGLWVPPDDRLHVSVPRNASRLRLPLDGPTSASVTSAQACIHWRRTPGVSLRTVETVPILLQQSLECMTDEMAIVLIDSALHEGSDGLTEKRLRREFEGLPARYRAALDRSDRRSESGIETLVRLRLRSRGVHLTTQFRHPGVGRVDLLVGDRLVIEVDGREHHDTKEAFASDRRRDLLLFCDGFERLRLTYGHVMFQWEEVERVILDAIRRDRHHWHAMDRPVLRPSAPHVFRTFEIPRL